MAGQAATSSFSNAGQVWSLLFTDEMIGRLVEATNRQVEYARTKAPRKKKGLSNTDEIEMRAFLGILYLMGAYKHPSEELGGLFSYADGTGRDIFYAVMTCNRALALLKYLRFGGSENDCQLSHLWGLFASFFENSRKNFAAGEHLTVDHTVTKGVLLQQQQSESILSIHQPSTSSNGAPAKPVNLKTFFVTDSMTSYVLNGHIEGVPLSQGLEIFSLPTQIVLHLLSPFALSTHQNHPPHRKNITAASSWFTSMELAYELLLRQYTYVGEMTPSRCRQIPRDFALASKNRRRPVGSAIYGFTDRATVISYMPRKNAPVVLLSTAHHEVRNEGGKPDAYQFYTASKMAISKTEKEGSIRAVLGSQDETRWELEMLSQLLDFAAINAHQLWQMCTMEEIRHRDFVIALARALILPEIERRNGHRAGLRREAIDAMDKVLEHDPNASKTTKEQDTTEVGNDGDETEVEAEEEELDDKIRPKRRCVFCKGRETKVRTVCAKCKKSACLKKCLKPVCPECYE